VMLMLNAAASDIAAATHQTGDLSKINTTDKRSIVNAINELHVTITQLLNTVVEFDPATPSTTSLYSSAHFLDLLANLKSDIEDSSPVAYDSLKKIADWISNDKTSITTILTNLNLCVSFADAMNLTDAQQTQACENIGVGDPHQNFLYGYYVTSDVNTAVVPGYIIPGYTQ